MTNTGWVCPVCGRGNAPFTPFCTCVTPKLTLTTTTGTVASCIHTWITDLTGTRCSKCGTVSQGITVTY